MNLYDHQKKIITDDPKRTGLWLGTGSGKTRTALMLARGKTLVICPKTQKEDMNWEREQGKIKLGCTSGLAVISKETFRRDHASLPAFDTVIVDEAHTCLGATPNVIYRKRQPYPKTSQLFEALTIFLKRTQPSRLYLCTATIIKSPMTVWAGAVTLGHDWDFYKFRDRFYYRLAISGREIFMLKKDDETKNKLAELVKKIGYTGRLEEYFDVPDQTFKTIHIDLTEAQKKRLKEIPYEFPEPIVRCGKIHQIENGILAGDEFNKPEVFANNKIEKILELALEFPKMIIFAKYTAQIFEIYTTLLKEGYKVLVLDGKTKDKGAVLDEAKSLDKCIVIAQAQISSGWELPEFPCMIFASKTYSFVDWDQSLGRIQRANNIKKNIYISLVVRGAVDEAVDKCISQKQDFSERIYAEKGI